MTKTLSDFSLLMDKNDLTLKESKWTQVVCMLKASRALLWSYSWTVCCAAQDEWPRQSLCPQGLREMVLFSRRMGIKAFRYTTEIQWKGTSHHLMRHSGRPWGNWALWLYDKCMLAAVILEWPATHIVCSPALFVLEDVFSQVHYLTIALF